MSTKDNQVVTGEVRFSYAYLDTPKGFSENDIPKYSITILIPKNTPDGQRTIADIKNAIDAAVDANLGIFNGKRPAVVKHTLKDGDTETNDLGELKNVTQPELSGHMYMRLATQHAPKVLMVDDNGERIVLKRGLTAGGDEFDEKTVQSEIYSGCYGRVSLTTFAYNRDGNRGVSASLNNVFKTRDGEPLGGTLSGDEFFDN